MSTTATTTNVVDVIRECENRLGWSPRRGIPLWKARAAEAGKLKTAMSRHGVTLAEVRMALEYSWRRRSPIDSPVALVFRVEEARQYAASPTPLSDIAQQIQQAVDYEVAHPSADSDIWMRRLLRSTGTGRAATLAEWRQARAERAA